MRVALFVFCSFALAAAGTGTYERALDLFAHTDYAGAAAALRNSSDAKSLELLGRSYLMEGDYKKAVEALEKASALEPSNGEILTWLGRAYGRRAETGFGFGAMSNANKARAAFEKAVQIDGKNGEALDDLFSYYLDAPGFLGGGLEKATKLVPKIGSLDPAQARFSDARLAEKRKEFSVAEAHLRDALRMSPHNVGRFIDLAAFLSRRGRYDESDKVFEQASKIAPNSPKILFARAEVLIHAHRNLKEARDLLHRYLGLKELTPDDPSRAEATQLLHKAESEASGG